MNANKRRANILAGKEKFTPKVIVTIGQDAAGMVMIGTNVPMSLSAIMDLVLQSVTQLWLNIKKADSMIINPAAPNVPAGIRTVDISPEPGSIEEFRERFDEVGTDEGSNNGA